MGVVTHGFDRTPVTSMGGLETTPQQTLDEMDLDDVAIFIIPGGELWEKGYPEAVMHDLVRRLDEQKIPMAAICAAVTMLAKAGILEGRRHTGNALSYMKKLVPGYAGEPTYVDELAVADNHIITASGLGTVDFTMAILETLDVATPEMRQLWYDAFKHGRFPEGIDAG